MGGSPAPRAGRPGNGPGAPWPDARDPRQLPDRAASLRQRGARLGQLGAARDGRHRRAEGPLAAPAAGGRPAQRLQHDRASHAGLGSHAAGHSRRARRRGLGDRGAQVVLLERLDRRLPDRDGGHQPRGPCLPARLDVHRADRHPRRRDPAGRADDGASLGAVRRLWRARGNRLRERPCSRRGAARRRGRGLHPRPAPARARADPSLHALARRRSSGLRHDVRACHLPARPRLAAWHRSRPFRTGSPTAPRRCRRRA